MSGDGERTVGTRWPELGVAAILMAVATLVIADSLRVGTGWADDGPRSGTFPFYVGCLLMASALWVFVSQLWRGARQQPAFAEVGQIRLVVAMLVPMVVYVGLIYPLGLYVASALLIGYFMKRYGRYGWPATVATSVAVPAIFFAVFERWFLVPLPKGPLEAALGL